MAAPEVLMKPHAYAKTLIEGRTRWDIISKLTGNALVRMVTGAAVGFAAGLEISYLGSGGTPLKDLMLQASMNSKSIWYMSFTEVAEQLTMAAAFVGIPIGAFLGSSSPSRPKI